MSHFMWTREKVTVFLMTLLQASTNSALNLQYQHPIDAKDTDPKEKIVTRVMFENDISY